MSEQTPARLYNLLPAIYRIRDTGEGQPLRALFAVIEQELQALEQDIGGLYDNWFIETCEEWVVPYIGDLLKVPALHTGGVGTFSLRAYIANVLKYRRRKGTASVLEQMANDVTGWVARVVEFHKLLGTTQHLNHVRLENVRTPDLRDTNRIELLGGPFENAAYTADVRRIASGRGKYNIPNIGIFLWRLQSYPVVHSTAKPVENHPDGLYTVSPLGNDAPLFNYPQTETEITHIAEELNAPAPLRRRPLFEELENRRRAAAEGKEPVAGYFGKQPVFQIFVREKIDLPLKQAPAEEIMICNLEGWQRPPSFIDFVLPDKTKVSMPITVAVDPVLGRLAFPVEKTPFQAEVSYTYGFSSDVGGGPYDRSDSLVDLFRREEGAAQDRLWWAGVTGGTEARPSGAYATLREAVSAWNAVCAAGSGNAPTKGVIAVLDSRTYTEELVDADTIIVGPGRTLLIMAAAWRRGRMPVESDWKEDLNMLLIPEGLRPVVRGNIEVSGAGEAEDGAAGKHGKLFLNGLLIDGAITVRPGNLGELTLAHCTVKPEQGIRLIVESAPEEGKTNEELSVTIDRSICGSIHAPELMKSLRIIDSIVDSAVDPDEEGYPAPAISGEGQYGPTTTIERSTIFGTVSVRELALASETIFTEAVIAERLQTGCVRYCFVPLDSRAPRRFRCQPDLALAALSKKLERSPDEAERELVEERLRPVHTSTDYGDPGYAQLRPACPEEIRTGAEDGSEMGVFSHLKQPQREANLRINLEEYLRFGMEAGIFYVN